VCFFARPRYWPRPADSYESSLVLVLFLIYFCQTHGTRNPTASGNDHSHLKPGGPPGTACPLRTRAASGRGKRGRERVRDGCGRRGGSLDRCSPLGRGGSSEVVEVNKVQLRDCSKPEIERVVRGREALPAPCSPVPKAPFAAAHQTVGAAG
jgi:hypothetical protein